MPFFAGNSKHTTVTDLWYNDSEAPNLQGDTNRDVRDADGKCINVSITKLNLSTGEAWPAPAQAIIDNAGRRTGGVLPPAVAPALSPPSPSWPPSKNYSECNTPAPGSDPSSSSSSSSALARIER